jgi:hypothetical protein
MVRERKKEGSVERGRTGVKTQREREEKDEKRQKKKEERGLAGRGQVEGKLNCGRRKREGI